MVAKFLHESLGEKIPVHFKREICLGLIYFIQLKSNLQTIL
jgi:hypothetical protein